MKCRFLDVLAGKEALRPPPLWMMRQAGRYLPEYRETRSQAGSFLALCGNPELAAEVTLQPIRRFDFDAAIIFSDILTVPMALGHPVTFDEGPKLPALKSLTTLRGDRAAWKTVLVPVYEALERVRTALAPEKALIGFAGAPWTLAVYMAGGGNDEQKAARLWAYRDPNGFDALIGLLVDCIAQHLIWQLQAGAQAVQIFDSWAGGLPPVLFDRFVTKPTAAIVEKVRVAVPGAPVIGFPRGASQAQLESFAAASGVDALSIDPSIDMRWAVERLGMVQGNLDPLVLVAGGKALADAVAAILSATRGKPFIFNLGHGILPPTPIEHVQDLVHLVRSSS